MNNEKKKQDIEWIFFVLAYWSLIIKQIMEMMSIVPNFYSFSINYGNKVLWCGIFILAIIVVKNKPSFFELILCIWAPVTFLISDSSMMLIFVYTYIAAKKFDKTRIIKAWMIPVSITMLLSILLYPILYLKGSTFAVDLYGRETFFFNHPNSFGLFFCFWILGIIYLVGGKLPFYGKAIILLTSSVFLLRFPESSTPAVVLILGVVLLFLEKYSWKICKKVVRLIPVVGILTTIWLTAIYYFGILPCDQKVLHRTFSMRFQDAAINLKACPLNLWGQKIPHLGQYMVLYDVWRPEVSMDNGIIAALIYYGIIFGMLFLVLFVASIFLQTKSSDKRQETQVILLAMTFCMGIMEWPAWYITIGFPMFFLDVSINRK